MSNITLAQGGGGEEFGELVTNIRSRLKFTGAWENVMDDGATFGFSEILRLCGGTPPSPPCRRQRLWPRATCEGGKTTVVFGDCDEGKIDGGVAFDLKEVLRGSTPLEGSNPFVDHHLVFTTDGFVVDPLFFNGGDIGKISFCGTVNDLAMMGAVPLGLSMAMIIEEGLDQEIVDRVLESINQISQSSQIPIATGDTKVMGKGQIDKMVITTAGVGVTKKIIKDSNITIGDKIIVSGGLGEHGATLLAHRFDYETALQSDCRPLVKEMQAILHLIASAKDITRGGTAAIFNEMANKAGVKFIVEEAKMPFKQEVKSISNILGISQYSLACEGRFVCIASSENAIEVERILKEFNSEVAIVGEVVAGSGVVLKTEVGERVLEPPRGKLVPRIC